MCRLMIKAKEEEEEEGVMEQEEVHVVQELKNISSAKAQITEVRIDGSRR